MLVTEIAVRRRGLAAVSLSPPAPKGLEGAEYEGDRLLIDREILNRCDIKEKTTLTDADLRQLVFVSECYRAKQRAVWLLSLSDTSEKALYDKLCRLFTKRAAAFGVEQMVKSGYLNDERYANGLVEKFKQSNLSLRQIKVKLAQKGISTELIKRLLSQEKDDLAERQRLSALVRAKYMNKLSDGEQIKKTVAALKRRGFSHTDIKAVIDNLLGEDTEY